MKKTLLIILLAVLSVSAIAQEQKKPEMPFYNKNAVIEFYKRQSAADTLWLPAIVTDYYVSGNKQFWEYNYDEYGVLKKFINKYPAGEKIGYYNHTYTVQDKDILDTLTYYRNQSGEMVPYERYYYDNYQSDFYYAWTYQIWNGQQWKTNNTTEYFLMDSLTVSGFVYKECNYSGDGIQTDGWHRLVTFDDKGNVTLVTTLRYNPDAKSYVKHSKDEYAYDENNLCYEDLYYLYLNGEYALRSKLNYTWEEFHGFADGDPLYFQIIGNPDPDKINKLSTKTVFKYTDDVERIYYKDEYFWNIDGNQSAEQHSSLYSDYLGDFYRSIYTSIYFDQQANRIKDETLNLDHPDDNGNQDTMAYSKHTYENYYDNRNRLYKYDFYQTSFMFGEGSLEHKYLNTMVVDSFVYFVNPVGIHETFSEMGSKLKIIPNPSNGNMVVRSNGEVKNLSVYAINGKEVYQQEVSGKEAIIQAGALPQGIYILKARLKNGGMQVGKLVVQ